MKVGPQCATYYWTGAKQEQFYNRTLNSDNLNEMLGQSPLIYDQKLCHFGYGRWAEFQSVVLHSVFVHSVIVLR